MNLTPADTTYWFVYDIGLDLLHTGITEPGEVTSTNAGVIDYGAGVLTRLEVHKAKLHSPVEPQVKAEEEFVRAGFYLHADEIILLEKSDCEGKPHLYKALQDKATKIAEAI